MLGGGVSNRTVRVKRSAGPDLVLKQALESLRVAVEWRCDPARIHREAEGMRVLQGLLPAGGVPGFVFEDLEHDVLAMEAVPETHVNWKTMLLEGCIGLDVVGQFGRNLGRIHRGFDVAGYPEDGPLRNKDFFERLRLEPYYAYTAARQPAAAGFLDRLIVQARERAETLVHGDYSPKNVLVHRKRMVLLDHEVIHIGDPAFDVGFAMTHFLSKANHMFRDHGEAFGEAALAFWTAYRAEAGAGADCEVRAAGHTLGCLLARVAGRSPLEYLSGVSRRRQGHAAVALLEGGVERMPDLVERFLRACRP